MQKKPHISAAAIPGVCGLIILLMMAAPVVAAWDNPFVEEWPPCNHSYITAGWWRLYSLPELQTLAVKGGWQLGSNQVTAAVRQFGWPAYRELGADVGWSRRRERLAGGVNLYLYRLQVHRYPPRQGANCGCYLTYSADSSWTAGIALENWLPPGCGEATTARFDLSLLPATWLRLHLRWVEQRPGRAGALLGLHLVLPRQAVTGAGMYYDTRSGQLALGLQLQKGRMKWRIDLLVHPQLGWSQRLQSGWLF